ncbi:bifunctional adenosylcobinamide kinase/adenosylcobinamide-phosphate guanylyltransferase [Photobacterium sp. TY1-4]|uniref:bifunctional adenosylcobinamide kinase/adenosylcobinamide-phosphate guanylyltransferase n=1 Tax=Photobacterium sp. TY1-4 TaxID=2899122 RepID=UPI0021C1594B|nr:bifunctional adenosylcobinamide kinase/adenosylcobinamide-phosphate guanylyltransferase [Photobacterium sp. TY1-4]UXI04173.1 bifunctional adenosylcobinamide kinase/adenosylcobinamide-phosphate guanylyltransferase [Photobacterium sp. TY1-4]
MKGTELILGGARSGKSNLAEQLAAASGLDVIYVATATAGDEEMAERIARHQIQRPAAWQVVEEPEDLAGVVQRYSRKGTCLLIDCLTLWLTNCLCGEEATHEHWQQHKDDFLTALLHAEGRIILVSNEVGQGIVPMGELSRRFVDESGWLHQAIARQAERVVFVTAGIPQVLKGPAW